MGFSVKVGTIDAGRIGACVTGTAGVTTTFLFSFAHPAVNKTATSKRVRGEYFMVFMVDI
jgi:hypothetical protein